MLFSKKMIVKSTNTCGKIGNYYAVKNNFERVSDFSEREKSLPRSGHIRTLSFKHIPYL